MLTNTSFNDIQEKIEMLPVEHKDYVNQMFQNAPLSLFEKMELVEYKKGTIFIRENGEVNKVYVLLEGFCQAMDHRILGNEYDYMRFRPVKVFGSMEILLGFDRYQTTMVADTDATFLIINHNEYKKWIENDNNALLMETKSMGRYLLEQGKKERLFLFLQGKDRLFLVFTEEYGYCEKKAGKATLVRTRQELSDCSGLSVRTINRALKSMKDDGYITYNRSKIYISENQYLRMKEYLEAIVA